MLACSLSWWSSEGMDISLCVNVCGHQTPLSCTFFSLCYLISFYGAVNSVFGEGLMIHS